MKTSIDKKTNTWIKHVWQIPAHLKCHLVGTCLSVNEHKKILKRCGHRVKGLTAYGLHQAIMGHMENENRISRKIDRFLKHKYSEDLSALKDLDGDDFHTQWERRFSSGRMEGIFYVAAVKPDLDDEILHEVFGDVHMAGHANMAVIMDMRKRLERQKIANQKLSALLQQQKRHNKTLREKMVFFEKRLAEAQLIMGDPKRDARSSQKNRQVAKADAAIRELKVKLRDTEGQIRCQQQQLRLLEREKRRLQIDYFDIKSTNQMLATEIKTLIAQISASFSCTQTCSKQCPEYSLCARRILVVGGITRMKHLYRELIESSGGEFEYHDGYMKAGQKTLEMKVRRSDLVLCPVNCNSHGACHKVKAFCKKYGKPIRMLPGSSLSMISGALLENGSQNSLQS
jgi:hypothetical protein